MALRTNVLGSITAATLLSFSCSDDSGGGDSDGSAAKPEPGPAEETPEPEVITADHPNGLRLNFTKLEAAEAGSYVVEIEIFNGSPTTSWSLYYSTTRDLENSFAIQTGISGTVKKIEWETSFVDDGTYYLYGVVNDDGLSTVTFADSTVVISGNQVVTNRAPIITFSSPSGNSVYAPGDSVALTFNASDPEDDEFAMTIEFTTDGSVWAAIAEDVSKDTNTFSWTVPNGAAETARYRLRIKATDTSGSTSTVENSSIFGVRSSVVSFTSTEFTSLVAAKCATASCHDNAMPAAGLDMTSYGDTTNVSDTILTRTRAGAASPMPPSGSPALTQEERDIFQFWIWAGTPQTE